jgi:hypothetical protein
MGEPPEGLGLESTPIMENPLVIIAAPDHPLAGRRRIAVEALGDQGFVFREPGSGTRAAILRVLEEKGVSIRITMEMTSNEAIKQTVQAGLGLGIVSRYTVELELETGRLVELDVRHFPLRRHWYLVRRRDKQLSPVARRFESCVLDTQDGASPNQVFSGPWALFRLLDSARIQPRTDTRFLLSFAIGGSSARVLLDAATIRNPLRENVLQGFSCGR